MVSKMLETYAHSKINDDFDLDIPTIAKNCKGYSRFKYLLGGNVSAIESLLKTVKDAGVSPAYFASYECGEGYVPQFGWLNHTYVNGSPTNDAVSVCNWIKSQSKNMSGTPAWYDAAFPVNFVPQSVQNEGNADYQKIPSGSIGRVTIAGTAAATWEYYYPNGLKASYNKVQDYGPALTHQYKRILDWGGKIDGKGGSDDDDDGSSSSGSNGSTSGGSSALDIVKKAMDAFLDKLEDALTWDLHSVGADKYFSNALFHMEKTFNNTYRVSMGQDLINAMDDLVNSIDTGSSAGDDNDNPKDNDDDKPSSSHKSVKPNGKNATQIGGPWTWSTLPQKYKKAMEDNSIPKFDPSYLSGSPFVATGDAGQCTELTWAYMHQIWKKKQPAWDNQVTNGQRVWEVYKAQGAKTTHSPTVGYGFSSKPPYIQASLVGIGHTGVVITVNDDGSFVTANYNIYPNWAQSRIVTYSLINGVPENGGTNFMFFSGIGQQ